MGVPNLILAIEKLSLGKSFKLRPDSRRFLDNEAFLNKKSGGKGKRKIMMNPQKVEKERKII